MGEITRCWPFEAEEYLPFDLVVREPPLTGDNPGLKTWGSSYVLAQMLHTIGETWLSHLLGRKDGQPKPSVLELGSGTGLLGLAAAAIWQTRVIASDLPEIMPNLTYNIQTNRPIIQERGGSMEAGALTWGGEEGETDPVLFTAETTFKVIIAADAIYDNNHPALLACAIDERLCLDKETRAMVMVPQRDTATIKLISTFKENMASKKTPLVCLQETVVAGQDDWGGDEDEDAAHVKCWLGVFARRL